MQLNIDPAGIAHLRQVAYPALVSGPVGFLGEIAVRLAAAGVQCAVARRDSAPIYDWLMTLVSLQGISDQVALGWDAEHGGVTWAEVNRALDARPSCPRLRSWGRFQGCGYRKGRGTCAEPGHYQRCPLPKRALRKGGLNVAAFGLALFVREVCAGDFVAWLDASLAHADPGPGSANRAETLGIAVVKPLTGIVGIGPKLWSLMLAELLLVGDPGRERWVTAGAGMVAVDSLVHAFLHRTGSLRRCGAEHRYGPACYAPGGCAEILRRLAESIDARQFNPRFPAHFPRWVQHALWQFCSEVGGGPCNGRRINDRGPCRQRHCPAFARCDRVTLHGTAQG